MTTRLPLTLALSIALAATAVAPVWADTAKPKPDAAAAPATQAPPAVPSSYELRRLEAKIRKVLDARAAEAKKKSRQIERVGTGTAAGPETDGSPFSLDISARQAVGLGVTALIGFAAFTAFAEESSVTLPGSGGGGRGGGSTATGTR